MLFGHAHRGIQPFANGADPQPIAQQISRMRAVNVLNRRMTGEATRHPRAFAAARRSCGQPPRAAVPDRLHALAPWSGASVALASLEAEIARIRSLGLDELRTLWRTTFRSAPPSALRRLLAGGVELRAFPPRKRSLKRLVAPAGSLRWLAPILPFGLGRTNQAPVK